MIERWLYQAETGDDPIGALARKIPKHAGTQPSSNEPLRRAIELLYRQHPTWSFQLLYDNLRAVAEKDPGNVIGRPSLFASTLADRGQSPDQRSSRCWHRLPREEVGY